jgi:hypothetical protein
MPRIALVTCAEFATLEDDDKLLLEPLARLGIEAVPAIWDDPAVDWSSFDLVVLRSPWDYAPRRDEFVAWTRRVPRLANRADVVAWNTDKGYLRELGAAGVPVVPTQWLRPGDPDWQPDPDGEVVVKPAISAGSQDTGRYRLGDPEQRALALAHAQRLLAAGRTVMVQPYLSAVDHAGETALLFFAGRFSHAIRKGAMLDGPDLGVEGLFKAEEIAARVPTPQERAAAEQVLAVAPADLLYARVDLIPGPDGAPMLIELELTEPSVFLGYDDGAAQRFAEAIAGKVSDGV